jgi:multidrug efflux pump subunit AcrA (membrane-fusion protein)
MSTARRFPVDAGASAAARRRRRIRRVAFGLGVAVVVATGAGVTAAALSRGQQADFRTATVTTQDLESRLGAVAAIEPISEAAVAFPVAGTVATVDVAPGAQVTVGQQLATLDTTQMQAQLHTSQAALDQAKLILAKALDGEDVSALLRTGGAGMARAVSLLPVVVEPTFTVVSDVGGDEIGAAQQAVLAAQHAVDAARSTAAAKLDSATSVCAAVGADVDPSDPAGATSTIQACQSALQDVVSAQGAVSDAQADLVTAASKLDDLLDHYAEQLQSTPTTTAPPTTPPPATEAPTTTAPPAAPTQPGATAAAPSPTPTTTTVPRTGAGAGGGGGRVSGRAGASSSASRSGATPSFNAGGGAGTVASPSSADLISYQAAVDSAAAAVAAAQQALDQARIVSPIAGTVVDVGVATGEQVAAESSTQQILVQGLGGYEATASLDLTDVVHVEVGQPAALMPDGMTAAVAGHVVSVSALPDSSASTTTYRVTVGLDSDTSSLRNGAIGSLSIVTATAKGVLAVPSSAVTSVGARHVVRVVDGATATATPVGVGVVGDTWTEITSGLRAGQQVVVADLGAPLPSAATATSQTTARQFARTFGGAGGGFVRPGG